MIQAEGYAYDPVARDWTIHVIVTFATRMEAIRWINFQRDWLKGLRIIEGN